MNRCSMTVFICERQALANYNYKLQLIICS